MVNVTDVKDLNTAGENTNHVHTSTKANRDGNSETFADEERGFQNVLYSASGISVSEPKGSALRLLAGLTFDPVDFSDEFCIPTIVPRTSLDDHDGFGVETWSASSEGSSDESEGDEDEANVAASESDIQHHISELSHEIVNRLGWFGDMKHLAGQSGLLSALTKAFAIKIGRDRYDSQTHQDIMYLLYKHHR